jgi:hypothetical protein
VNGHDVVAFGWFRDAPDPAADRAERLAALPGAVTLGLFHSGGCERFHDSPEARMLAATLAARGVPNVGKVAP